MEVTIYLRAQSYIGMYSLTRHPNVNIFNSISSIPDCQCQFLQVILVNEALTYQWDKQGTYELSAEINGKASWKSATQAIWFNSTFKNWMIGALSKNEDDFRGITSIDNLEYDCPQQVGNLHWKYHYGNDTLKSCSKDVTIQCTGKNEQDSRCQGYKTLG